MQQKTITDHELAEVSRICTRAGEIWREWIASGEARLIRSEPCQLKPM